MRAPPSPASGAVRALLDQRHGGNIQEAAERTGLPYATLQQIYAGTTANPSLRTLTVIAATYGIPFEIFVDVDAPRRIGELPDASIHVPLPPDPESGPTGRVVRIPTEASSLHQVWTLLWDYLTGLPPSRDRPIIGGARDVVEAKRRLGAFLLGPLRVAQDDVGGRVLHAEPPFPGMRRPTAHEQVAMMDRLTRLGQFWEVALPDLLRASREDRKKRLRHATGAS